MTSGDPVALSVDDLAACRGQLRGGSRSFHAASLLLPEAFREPACALYAFCRMADDLIDGQDDCTQALRQLHRRLEALYAGRPEPDAADRALAEVVRAHGLPKALLEALLEGFAWDAEGRRYEEISGVLAYSARVAGSVGAMMAVLMGSRDHDMLARACDLGVAMQLTNIARDVGEDAAAGRLYLPRRWLREAGIDPDAFLEDPVFSPALGSVIERLLSVADVLYRRADSGIARLPRACRGGIYAARLLYAEIGHELRRRGLDSVSKRAVVSTHRKLWVLLKLPRLFVLAGGDLKEKALAENRFLVDAVAEGAGLSLPNPAGGLGRLARIERRLVWILDLFEELERRDRPEPLRVVLADDSAG
ncbi:MAG: phytoene/squalene synthase family protein [Chromatiales bacterium]